MRYRHAFTLIELLVVIALIGMLVGILLPSLQQARELALRSVCAANMHHIAVGLHMYASQDERGQFPPSPEWQNAADTVHLYSRHNHDRWKEDFWPAGGWIGYNDPWLGMGLLFDAGITENPESFFCPGVEDSKHLSWPSGWENELVHGNFLNGGYLYRLFGQPVPEDQSVITTEDIERLWHLQPDAEEALVADMFLDKHERGDPGHLLPIYGLNVAFADGHAEFLSLGPNELGRADNVIGTIYEVQDRFVWLYFQALGTRNFQPLDDAGFVVPWK